MIRNRRWRLFLYAMVLGTMAQVTACQVLPGQADAGVSVQALMDTIQTFIQDFAREALAAALV